MKLARIKTFFILPTEQQPADEDALAPAYYPYPNTEDPNQDLKDATSNIMNDAAWDVSEGTRQQKG